MSPEWGTGCSTKLLPEVSQAQQRNPAQCWALLQAEETGCRMERNQNKTISHLFLSLELHSGGICPFQAEETGMQDGEEPE